MHAHLLMLLTVIINTVLCSAAVLVHYEAFIQISNLINRLKCRHRLRVLITVACALCAHIVEIWFFAFGYYFLLMTKQFGDLQGNFDGSLLDCSYFSFTTYSSLGLGDVEPLGNIRFLAGLESITGLVLISWTASFVYIEMQRYWRESH